MYGFVKRLHIIFKVFFMMKSGENAFRERGGKLRFRLSFQGRQKGKIFRGKTGFFRRLLPLAIAARYRADGRMFVVGISRFSFSCPAYSTFSYKREAHCCAARRKVGLFLLKNPHYTVILKIKVLLYSAHARRKYHIDSKEKL